MHICGAKHSEFCQYQLRTVSPKLPTIILWFSKQKAEYHRLLCGFVGFQLTNFAIKIFIQEMWQLSLDDCGHILSTHQMLELAI